MVTKLDKFANAEELEKLLTKTLRETGAVDIYVGSDQTDPLKKFIQGWWPFAERGGFFFRFSFDDIYFRYHETR